MTSTGKRTIHGMLGLALAASVGAAQAVDAKSTVEITGITYELIDLEPSDGIAPSLTLIGESFESMTVYTEDDHIVRFPVEGAARTGSASLSRPHGSASTWWDGSHASASATINGSGIDSVGTAGINTYNVTFTLSPWTRLLITANANLDAQLNGDGTRAQTTVALEGGVTRGENDTWWNRFVNPYHHVENGSELVQLQGTLDSDWTAGTVSLRLQSFATASIYGQPAPIPEPARYAMLLAGVGVLGALARKRRQG